MTGDNDKPVRIVINPHSGLGGHGLSLAALRAELRREGIAAVEYVTRCPRDATGYVRAHAGRTSAVAVWGGDGTVNEVAEGLAGTPVPLLPCPAGTENLLAKELGVAGAPAAIAAALRRGRTADCDLARVNGRTFLMTLGTAFDGEVVRRVAAARSGHISYWSYFWPIWRTLWEHRFPRLRVVADGQEVFAGRGMAFVANISRYCAGLRVCREAKFGDGWLDLAAYPCRGRAGLLLHAARTLLGRSGGGVVRLRFRSLRIEADRPVPSQLDGDAGPLTPLDISLTGQQVRLLLPAATT